MNNARGYLAELLPARPLNETAECRLPELLHTA